MSEPKRVVWFSRHEPLPEQLTELRRLLGDIIIIIDPAPFDSAKDVVNRFRKRQGDEMVVVAPLRVVQEITKLGVQPIIAEMESHRTDGGKTVYSKFLGFKRVTAIEVKTEPIEGGKETE